MSSRTPGFIPERKNKNDMKIKVLFFGILTEVTEKEETYVEFTKPIDIESLKNFVLYQYPDIEKYLFKISVNKNLCEENISLHHGDEVAFLPPFAGG